MLIPAAMVKLHETHIALQQAPRQQTVRRVTPRLACVWSVKIEGALRLLRKIQQIRHRSLHAEGHLVLRDARFDLGIAEFVQVHAIQLAGRVEHFAARARVDPLRIVQVEHRIAAGPEAHTLVIGGQEAAAPQPREERLVRVQRLRLRQHHDERGQISILTAKSITNPRAHAGAAGLLAAALYKRDRRIVIDGVRVHRLDDRQLIDDLGGVRQQFADPCAGLPVLLEFEDGAGHWKRALARSHARDALPHTHAAGKLCAGQLVERRLVIEQIHLRWAARLVQENYPLGFG